MKLGERRHEWWDHRIWLSWNQPAIRLHFAIGSLDVMWLAKPLPRPQSRWPESRAPR